MYTQNIFGNIIPIIKYIYFIKNSKRNLYHRNKFIIIIIIIAVRFNFKDTNCKLNPKIQLKANYSIKYITAVYFIFFHFLIDFYRLIFQYSYLIIFLNVGKSFIKYKHKYICNKFIVFPVFYFYENLKLGAVFCFVTTIFNSSNVRSRVSLNQDHVVLTI